MLFPTATLPAIPMTYGIFGAIAPKNVAETRCKFCVALTYKFKRRVSGKYTATTSSRSMRSLIPRRASRSRSCNVRGVCARNSAQSWRSNRKYRSTSIASIMSELPRDYERFQGANGEAAPLPPVSTSTPVSVTNTVCSNWAVRLPSAVTAVQSSFHMRCW